MTILTSKTPPPRKTIDISEIDDQDDIEDPKQWRAAVNPKSGRTYWYHRIKRISTWLNILRQNIRN
jgi:hypothetical protein